MVKLNVYHFVGFVSLEFCAIITYLTLEFPASIPFVIAEAAFAKIVDVDAALLGFTGVIVAVNLQTWKERYDYSMVVLGGVVTFFVLSMLACLRGLVVGVAVTNLELFCPLACLVAAISFLFIGLVETPLRRHTQHAANAPTPEKRPTTKTRRR